MIYDKIAAAICGEEDAMPAAAAALGLSPDITLSPEELEEEVSGWPDDAYLVYHFPYTAEVVVFIGDDEIRWSHDPSIAVLNGDTPLRPHTADILYYAFYLDQLEDTPHV